MRNHSHMAHRFLIEATAVPPQPDVTMSLIPDLKFNCQQQTNKDGRGRTGAKLHTQRGYSNQSTPHGAVHRLFARTPASDHAAHTDYVTASLASGKNQKK